MKKNITKLLLLTSILSIGSILNAHNKDVSNDVKKPPINIRIDENGQVMKDQTGNNNSSRNNNNQSGRGGTQTIKNSAGSITVDSSYTSTGQNYRQRFIILHYTAMNREGSLKALTTNEVSAHYLISDQKNDPVYYLVDENKRAWHAGVSEWKTSKNLNDSSIGIEIVNNGNVSGNFEPFRDFQIKEVAVLVKYLADKYEIPATNILGHSDIAPQRKPDPGPLFPWEDLYRKHNIGMWYDNDKKSFYETEYSSTWNTLPAATVQAEFNKFGYTISATGKWDEQTKNVIKAFQYHFRPSKYDGKLDLETYAILKALNDKYNSK